jgi:Transposase DDE domain
MGSKKTLNGLARRSGFIRRKGKLTAYEFAVLMTVGQLSLKHPSLGAMVQAIEAKLSREALHQRFTTEAVVFMHDCLDQALRQKFTPPKSLNPALLRPFRRVMIFDSSSWDVDPKLKAVLPGSGGGASDANCKLQVGYEFKRGELGFFQVSPGIKPDQAYSPMLPDLVAKDDLALADLGFFKVETFRQYHEKGAFYLSRFLVRTTIRHAGTRELIDLGEVLRYVNGNVFELGVIMGKEKKEQTPCRLLCLRVSEQVANERRRKLLKVAKKKGRTPSQAHLTLCDWTLLVTNVSDHLLPATMAYLLYSLRWQIELLFKQLKSIMHIHQSNTGVESRLRCELYGKLLMAVLIHRVHAFFQGELWNSHRSEISFDKFHKRFQERAILLLRQCLISIEAAGRFLVTEIPRLLKACIKSHQPSRQTTLQRLDLSPDSPR